MRRRSVPEQAYRTLGVSRLDDFATIRRTWLKRVRALYPRVLHGDGTEAATRELAALNDAYDAMRRHRPLPEAATRTPAAPPRPQPHPQPPRPDSAPSLAALQQAAPREALDRFASARDVFARDGARTLRHA
ncbi:J domain-containing protein [Ponticoccus litoralis]|uniref:J domain-containing protein n=1 Tax=Ponticoccus litoralis TaxID=422297 RepID=A0AAW9SK50_9RHOB